MTTKKNRKRRMIGVYLLFMLALCLLGTRLYYIQIMGHAELAAAAARQQRIQIEGADARGIIYDRNGTPMTGTNKDYVYIIHRKEIGKEGEETLAAFGGRKISNYNKEYEIFTFSKFDAVADQILRSEYGAYVMEAERRYSNQQTAAHILGYVRELDGNGASGVELAYNEVLSERKRELYATADATGRILTGIGLSSNVENQSIGIVTTLDLPLQRKVEEILSGEERDSAVVVLNSKTGQILAAGSTPDFNPNRIKEYIDSDGGELVNKVIQGEYPPGSLFKIVVAAAALENIVTDAEGKPITLDTKFFCEGKQALYGIEIKCSTGGEQGHGEISLRDAFAKSCNCAFIQLGEVTGGEKILEMAKAFGFGKLALVDIFHEKPGKLTKVEDTAGAGIGNLSIGQGSMLVTPIQIARMTNVIANSGMDKGVSLLMDTTNAENRVISPYTAHLLDEMMEDTMRYGTGNNIATREVTAGKTGSAEAYVGGEYLVHGWFTGYFPVKDPMYTVVVFVENGRSGRMSAVPVFGQIEEYLSGEGN